MDKQNTIKESDNFGGRGRERRRTRRAARKEAKARGMKGKALRRYARDASQEVKAQQLLQKARSKGGKRAARLTTRAKKIQALDGRTRVGQSAMTAALAPVLPFKKAMTKALGSKGIDTKYMSFPMIVNSFYNNVVSNKNNYASIHRPIQDTFLEDHPANHYSVDEVNSLEDSNNFIAAIGSIVTAIIDFFKRSIKKKKEGEPMKKVEVQAADEAEKVVEDLNKKYEDNKPLRKGDLKAKSIVTDILDLGGQIGKALKGEDNQVPTDFKIGENGRPNEAGFMSGIGAKGLVITVLILLIGYAMFKK